MLDTSPKISRISREVFEITIETEKKCHNVDFGVHLSDGSWLMVEDLLVSDGNIKNALSSTFGTEKHWVTAGNQHATEKHSIKGRPPPVLVLHLSRGFIYSFGDGTMKITGGHDEPFIFTEVMDVTKFVHRGEDNLGTKYQYKLQSVLTYEANVFYEKDILHYVAFIRQVVQR